jgi:hypothetical protein
MVDARSISVGANVWVGAQRNARKTANTLLPGHPLEGFRLVGAIDIADVNRFRLPDIARPGRVSFHRAAIAIREAAPGDELHHTGVVA